jgi:hypothetical protein
MGLVIILSKFKNVGHRSEEAVLSYSGFIEGIKINRIVVLGLIGSIEKGVMYLVTLKGARINGSVLSGELVKIKRLEEVNF